MIIRHFAAYPYNQNIVNSSCLDMCEPYLGTDYPEMIILKKIGKISLVF